MSSYSLNTTRNLWVSEQAYLSFKSPVSAWVCRVGSKGSIASKLYKSVYAGLNCGLLFRSFFARLRKTLSGLIVIFGVFNSLNKFLSRIAGHGLRVFFSFQHSSCKLLAPAVPVGKVKGKISYLMQGGFRKHRKNFIDIFYFIDSSIHEFSIAQKQNSNKIKASQGRVGDEA